MNQSSAYKGLLLQAQSETRTALDHLLYSFEKAQNLTKKEICSEEELETLEAFTSRFARVVDLLVHRLLRAIDRYELLEPGTLLDAANRAEARGWISSVDWLRELKDTRNRIAHDYAGEEFQSIVRYCAQTTPDLKNSVEIVSDYIDNVIA
jgi:uncharacterized protein YutE (UPF0331/DUF86 family)